MCTMSRFGIVTPISAIFLIAVAGCIYAAPTQYQNEIMEADPRVYSQPELAEALARHYEALVSAGGTGPRNLDGIGGGHLLRQTRRGLDSLSGATFGENKRFDSLSGATFGTQKRNFDEIDRSAFNGFVKKNFDEIDRSSFDSFVKRNFDEIDRVGWGGFVKRRLLDAYLRNNKNNNINSVNEQH
ncbi:orcokinin peptides type B isoform X3 [Cephus cinctus]|uniref:Orcokinin peptides type B isoform X3 n=1 Tax=Cephus cinctus TaxID=211228 RepID=A0AAJ7W0B4_CEPCN|nr:orcokinin peptides type B isoform X3 [Cephus cinctus]